MVEGGKEVRRKRGRRRMRGGGEGGRRGRKGGVEKEKEREGSMLA